MPSVLVFLFGLIVVTAHLPGWSQPSVEPKSVLLLGAGALAWGWLCWRGRSRARFPMALLLPVGWLLLSALWSPAPFLGLQRMVWMLAACGLGALIGEEEAFEPFMCGFLAGTALHGALIFLQWIPSFRALLPPSLGIDPFQGIGRGLLHNSNMAAQPLLILAAWLLLSPQQPGRWRSRGHLLWILPALALTQSRLAIGVAAGLLAYTAIRDFRQDEALGIRVLKGLPLLLLSLAWSLTAHRWGWVAPLAGSGLALLGFRSRTSAQPTKLFPLSLLLAGLVLATLAGTGTYTQKNAAQTIVSGTRVQGDGSQLQRMSYYRVAALAFLERPLTGQGLGSARPLYPSFVDRNRPAAEIAYGDMARPNNLHSEPLELLMEGGLPLVLLTLGGFWWDRHRSLRFPLAHLLLPIAALALLDFPFHNPIGLLWAGIALVSLGPLAEREASHWPLRLLQGGLALGLLLLSALQWHVARVRPRIEAAFQAAQNPVGTHAQARALRACYPFSADLFDLDSKSAIQAAMSSRTPGSEQIQELDQLLRQDPFDHHLLLARAQIARRSGDEGTARELLARYTEVAPRDPARFFRLAQDALAQGKPQMVPALIQAARSQPGFSPSQESQAQQVLSKAKDLNTLN